MSSNTQDSTSSTNANDYLLFNGSTYTQNLQDILNKTAVANEANELFPMAGAFFNAANPLGLNYFNFFSAFTSNNIPTSWSGTDGFLSEYAYFLFDNADFSSGVSIEKAISEGNFDPTTLTNPNNATLSTAQQESILSTFTNSLVTVYEGVLQITGTNSANNGDWNAVDPSILSNMTTYFENEFTTYLNHIPYGSTNGIGNTTISPVNFVLGWLQFLTTSATLSPVVKNTSATNGTEIANIDGVTLDDGAGNVLYSGNQDTDAQNNYLTAYAGFFPPPASGKTTIFGDNLTQWITQYKATLNSFISTQVTADGYFDPGRSYQNWLQTVQSTYQSDIATIGIPATSTIAGGGPGIGGGSSVDSDPDHKLLVLNNIFAIIIEILDSMQQVAASQSEQLQNQTTWQQAYVNLQNQIHPFIEDNGDYLDTPASGKGETTAAGFAKPVGGDQNSDATAARNDLNNDLNANLTQTIQNNQGIVEDNSKSLQSSLNNTSDAINSLATLADTIVTDLQTIISAIFNKS